MTKEKEFFPHGIEFPIRLEHKEGKDLKDKKICFFQKEVYLQKYLDVARLEMGQYSVFYRDYPGT